MLIWGSKGHVVQLGAQGNRHCATCERERPFQLMLQYTARHFWYVFRWVTDKQYGAVCEVCQRGDKLDTKTVESGLKKSPISFGARWSWVFLVALIAIIAVVGTIEDSSRSTDRAAFLAAPQAGDRYVMNVASLLKDPQSSSMYGVLRVRAVKAGAIEFDAPTVFYSKTSGAKKDLRDGKIERQGYFTAEPLVLTREDIARLHTAAAIYSIER